jgi:hypothetical protein
MDVSGNVLDRMIRALDRRGYQLVQKFLSRIPASWSGLGDAESCREECEKQR